MTTLPMLVLPLWRACMIVCGAPMGIQCGVSAAFVAKRHRLPSPVEGLPPSSSNGAFRRQGHPSGTGDERQLRFRINRRRRLRRSCTHSLTISSISWLHHTL